MKQPICKRLMKNPMLIISLRKTPAQGRNHLFVGLASSTAPREVQGPASCLVSVEQEPSDLTNGFVHPIFTFPKEKVALLRHTLAGVPARAAAAGLECRTIPGSCLAAFPLLLEGATAFF